MILFKFCFRQGCMGLRRSSAHAPRACASTSAPPCAPRPLPLQDFELCGHTIKKGTRLQASLAQPLLTDSRQAAAWGARLAVGGHTCMLSATLLAHSIDRLSGCLPGALVQVGGRGRPPGLPPGALGRRRRGQGGRLDPLWGRPQVRGCKGLVCLARLPAVAAVAPTADAPRCSLAPAPKTHPQAVPGLAAGHGRNEDPAGMPLPHPPPGAPAGGGGARRG